ncbi:hypothetical protein, partial [Mycobacterium sp.]|uniref:hypothetical protein n=1 Tax=Mycobacterium sp. TaxID=1785 RepID=UPI002B9931BD
MPVAGQRPQVRGHERIRRTEQPILPPGLGATLRSCSPSHVSIAPDRCCMAPPGAPICAEHTEAPTLALYHSL